MNWLVKYMVIMFLVVLFVFVGVWVKYKLIGGGEDWCWVG